MRFKDLQQDAQHARDEIAELMNQRMQWIEEKANLERSVRDFSDKVDERDKQLIEKDDIIKYRDALISEANKNNQELVRLSTKQHDDHMVVKSSHRMLMEVEQQLREKIVRLETQLKEEVYKNSILQRAALNSKSTVSGAGSTTHRSGGILLEGSSTVDDGPSTAVDVDDGVIAYSSSN